MLGQAAEKEELFKQMRERVTVLRGAFFSGFVALCICVFACIAPQPEERYRQVRKIVGMIVAVGLMVLAIRSALEDLAHPTIFDLPILEAVLGAIAIFGGFLVLKGVRRPCFLRVRFLFAITLCVALSYGGWIWSEVLYDRQVISSSVVLENTHGAANVQHLTSGKSDAPASERAETVDQGLEVH